MREDRAEKIRIEQEQRGYLVANTRRYAEQCEILRAAKAVLRMTTTETSF